MGKLTIIEMMGISKIRSGKIAMHNVENWKI